MFSGTADLTCREWVELLADDLSGELSPTLRWASNAHRASCDACASYRASYAETIRLSRIAARADRDEDENAPGGLISAVLAARAADVSRSPSTPRA